MAQTGLRMMPAGLYVARSKIRTEIKAGFEFAGGGGD